MLRVILFFGWPVPLLILFGLVFLPAEHEHDFPGLGGNLLLLTLGLLLCHLTTEYVIYCRRTNIPTWLMFGWASVSFLAIGVPLFASGSIAKGAPGWERDRWMLGFVLGGTGLVSLLLSATYLLCGWFTDSRSQTKG